MNSTPILPSLTGKVAYQFNPNWSLKGRADYQAINKNRVWMAEAGVQYQLNPEWDIELKYSHTNNRWESSSTQYKADSVVFAVTNHF
nr:outer membrane beta-barrel protein [Vibrio mexicanus]